MTKVVDFTKAKKRTENTPETPSEGVQDANYDKVDELVYSWGKVFIDMLDESEIGDDSEEFWRSYALFTEAFRSVICYDQGLEHPFHNLAEKLVKISRDDVDDVIIEFNDCHIYITDEPLFEDETDNTSI